MIDHLLLLGFVATTLLFVATPGPSVAFASAQAIRHGERAMVLTIAGDAFGTVVHIAVAAASLSVLVSLSSVVLPFLQIAGGVFILNLAYRSFRDARRTGETPPRPTGKATFWAGFFVCVTNPKAIVFFVALFPAFISSEHSILWQSLIYGAIFVMLDALSIFAYAMLASRAARRAASRWINVNTLSGLRLLGVGSAMIIKGYRAIP